MYNNVRQKITGCCKQKIASVQCPYAEVSFSNLLRALASYNNKFTKRFEDDFQQSRNLKVFSSEVFWTEMFGNDLCLN